MGNTDSIVTHDALVRGSQSSQRIVAVAAFLLRHSPEKNLLVRIEMQNRLDVQRAGLGDHADMSIVRARFRERISGYGFISLPVRALDQPSQFVKQLLA